MRQASKNATLLVSIPNVNTMLDHVGLHVEDFADSMSFYEKSLAPLGIKPLHGEAGSYFGFGDTRPFFWISTSSERQPHATAVHIAFAAKNKEEVNAFHAAALAAGGKDNGAPGYRVEYHAGYYGAFVLDVDGNNVEAVYHDMSLMKVA